jgi:hypothetical protein
MNEDFSSADARKDFFGHAESIAAAAVKPL